MKPVHISELWHAIQSGELRLPQAESSGKTGQLRPLNGNLETLAEEYSMPAEYVRDYEAGKFKELLRKLEKQSDISLYEVLLKVLCLLHMAKSDESIGNKHPVEYLRDRILPQLKQVEYQDETGVVSERREWLELYCYGHELPSKFWNKLI